jgi:hypothetical protein
VEVSSRGEFIEAGMPLEVSRIDGNRIVVRASAHADETGGREAGA